MSERIALSNDIERHEAKKGDGNVRRRTPAGFRSSGEYARRLRREYRPGRGGMEEARDPAGRLLRFCSASFLNFAENRLHKILRRASRRQNPRAAAALLALAEDDRLLQALFSFSSGLRSLQFPIMKTSKMALLRCTILEVFTISGIVSFSLEKALLPLFNTQKTGRYFGDPACFPAKSRRASSASPNSFVLAEGFPRRMRRERRYAPAVRDLIAACRSRTL